MMMYGKSFTFIYPPVYFKQGREHMLLDGVYYIDGMNSDTVYRYSDLLLAMG